MSALGHQRTSHTLFVSPKKQYVAVIARLAWWCSFSTRRRSVTGRETRNVMPDNKASDLTSNARMPV